MPLQKLIKIQASRPDIVVILALKYTKGLANSRDFLVSECCWDCIIRSYSVPCATVIIFPYDKGDNFVLDSVSIIPHPMVPERISIKHRIFSSSSQNCVNIPSRMPDIVQVVRKIFAKRINLIQADSVWNGPIDVGPYLAHVGGAHISRALPINLGARYKKRRENYHEDKIDGTAFVVVLHLII